jgi:hypothetical protein
MTKLARGIRFLSLCVVVFWTQAPSHAQTKVTWNTSFGALLTPAQSPLTTQDETWQAVLELSSIGTHASAMWEWRAGETGYTATAQLVPLLKLMGLKSVLQFDPTEVGQPSTPPGFAQSFADPAVRRQFVADALRLASLKPDYLNLAAEINLLYLFNPIECYNFSTLYRHAYRAVKLVSPTTKVGVSYHFDIFFTFNQASIIQLMGPQDFIGFTTYPSSLVYYGVYPSIDWIPADYYTRIRLIAPTQPIVFTEVGWPTGGHGNMQDEAAYLAALPRLMGGVKPEVISWALLHDVTYFTEATLDPGFLSKIYNIDPNTLLAELNTMGLLTWEGPPKPAYYVAKSIFGQQQFFASSLLLLRQLSSLSSSTTASSAPSGKGAAPAPSTAKPTLGSTQSRSRSASRRR